MSFHTQISRRYQVQTAMEQWMDGYTETLAGPSISEHVLDSDSFMVWLNRSGLDMAYYGLGDSSTRLPKNRLVGDVQLEASAKDMAPPRRLSTPRAPKVK